MYRKHVRRRHVSRNPVHRRIVSGITREIIAATSDMDRPVHRSAPTEITITIITGITTIAAIITIIATIIIIAIITTTAETMAVV